MRERYGGSFQPSAISYQQDDDGNKVECVFEVHTHGGRKPAGVEAITYAKQVVGLGPARSC